MREKIEELLSQSVALEQNASKLYSAFSRMFEEDRPFWSRLAAEERNHADLLQTLSDDLFQLDSIEEKNIFTESIASIRAANDGLSVLISSFDVTPIERRQTFDIALSLETGTGEKHLHVIAERIPSNTVEEVITVLLDADRQHAARIFAYARHCGFDLTTSD